MGVGRSSLGRQSLRRRSLRATSALPLVLAAFGGLAASGPAGAACVTAGTVTNCTSAAPNPYTATVGAGRTDDNRTVDVGSGASIRVQNRNAISLGDNARITLATGALVRTDAASGSGLYGTGPQPIEFDSNGVLVVSEGAEVISRGTQGQAEAVNVHGFGNRIENRGLISGQASAAIWFEDWTSGAKNVVDNYGTIEQINGATVIGTSGGSGIDFYNRTGAVVRGALRFASGNDDLYFSAGSQVTGAIDGGAGTNNLTLEGAAGTSDTLAGAIANFQTLTKDGLGHWTITGALSGFQSTTVNRGTLALTGDNSGYTAGVLVNPLGVLEARAQSLPTTAANTSNVRNNGRLRFVQDDGGTYTGQIVGSGVVEKQGAGVTTLAPTAAAGNTYGGGTEIDAGTLAVASDAALGAAAGGLAFDGGTLRTTASFATARPVTIEDGGATFEPTGATVLTASGPVSGVGALRKIGTGTLALTGANAYAGGTAIDAGTLAVASDAALGAAAGGLAFDGGTLRATGSFATARATTVAAGGGTFTTASGTVLTHGGTIAGPGAMTKAGAGTMVLTGAAAPGQTRIAAGRLQLGAGGTGGSLAGDVTNDGVLAFDRSDALAVAGTLGGTGSVVQQGSGTTRLLGDNFYFGTTTVSGGALYVNGDQSAATGATTAAGGTTLGGAGSIGSDVTLADGATLAPGDAGAVGTLRINGTLTLAAGSALDYSLGRANVPGGALNDRTIVGGDLVLDGTLNVTTSAGGAFDPGVYRVFDYAGTLTDDGLAIGTIPAPDFYVQTSVANQVNLVNTSGLTLNFWDGAAGPKNDGVVDGGDGTWQASAGNDNWTEASGVVNAPFSDGSFAIFQGEAGTVTVDGGLGAVTVSGMQFATDGYRVQGDAVTLAGAAGAIVRVSDGTATIASELTGGSRLVKTDAGTLVLTGTNTYTGGTAIDGGVLEVAADAALGAAAGDLGLDGGTLRTTATFATARAGSLGAGGGTIETAAGELTASGVIGGDGALTKTGAGTLVLIGSNGWSGGTAIEEGAVSVSSDANLGAAAGALSIDGATLRTTAGFATGRATTLGAGGATIETLAGELTANGVVGGDGALTKTGAGTLVLNGTNGWSGGTTIEEGTVSVSRDANLGAAAGALSIDGATLRTTAGFATARATTLGAGGGTIETAAGTLRHGGAIDGAGGLAKTGAGTLVLGGANAYAGATTVAAGALYVNGDQSAARGATTAATGTTLGGGGTIGGDVTVDDGATLAPGRRGAVPGTLSIAGDLALGAGATLDYGFGAADVVGGALNDLTVVAGDLRLDGTLNVATTPGGSFGPGIYRVISYGGTLTDGGLAIGAIPSTGFLVQTAIANQVNLVNTDGLTLTFWDGAAGPKNDGVVDGGDGTWQASGGNDNWTEASGAINAPWTDAGVAIFSAAAGTVTVDDGLGTVAASGMQFATDGYLVEGDAILLAGAPDAAIRVGDGTAAGAGMTATIASALTGASRLVKTDLGTLVLAGANSHAGGTAIDGGVVEILDDGALGAAGAGLSLDGGTLRAAASLTLGRATTLGAGGGTFEAGTGITLTQAGGTAGSGGLTKTGAGTLVIAGRATHGGETTVGEGIVAAGAAGVLSAGSAHAVAAAGGLDLAGFDQRVARLANAGVVAFGQRPGTRLAVAGDYVGQGGVLRFATTLGGDASPTDRMTVAGDATGTGTVEVVNAGGFGGATTNGIKLIDVAGASEATFTLAGDTVVKGRPVVIGGAYAYSLWQGGVDTPDDGDWYLRSQSTIQPGPPQVQPGIAVDEGYPLTLLALNGLPTMQERVGNRYWSGSGDPAGVVGMGDATAVGSAGTAEARRTWARVEGSRVVLEADGGDTIGTSTYDMDVWKLQVGVDGQVAEADDAVLVGGLTFSYGKVSTDVGADGGDGDGGIDTEGYGLGATLTWLRDDDVYVDGQVQAMWYDSDLSSDATGDIVDGNDGFGYALGVELGRRIAWRDDWTVTPQAQLVYSSVDFDAFTDQFNASVDPDDGASMPLRLGITVDQERAWKAGAGDGRRTHFYGIANLTYDLIDGTGVRVGGAGFSTEVDRLWGLLGLGGTYSWGDGAFGVYGEGLVRTSLENVGDSYANTATFGIRMAW